MRIVESITILVYLVVLIGIGVYFSKRALSSEDDYWLAGRTVNSFVGAFAIFAAVASGSSLYGSIGLGWTHGVTFYITYGLSSLSLFPFALYIFAAQMRRTGVRTLPEFFKKRFSNTAQIVSSIIVVIFMILYCIPQLTASGFIGSYVLGMPYATVVILVGVGFTIYAAIGGMWAITYTDFIQGLMMVGGTSLLAIVVLSHYGGFGELVQAAAETNPGFLTAELPWMSYFGLFFVFIWFAIYAPSAVMRNLTAKSSSTARRSMVGASLLYILLFTTGLAAVTAATAINPPGSLESADLAYLTVIETFLSPLVGGILLASILASVMSSTDSFLLATASGVAHDLYKGNINPKAPETSVTRLGLVMMFIAAAIAIFFALNPVQLITVMVVWVSGGMLSAFGVPIILGLWWKRATNEGALAGMIGGFVSYAIFMIIQPFALLSEFLVSTPISLILMVVVSLMTKEPPLEVQQQVEDQHSTILDLTS